MHLWPSTRLRDSFKMGYLKKLEWNLNRMKSQKNNHSQTSKLLDDDNNNNPPSEAAGAADETPNSKDLNSSVGGTLLICRELLMILSCCYCCFCCGACIDDEEK